MQDSEDIHMMVGALKTLGIELQVGAVGYSWVVLWPRAGRCRLEGRWALKAS